MKCVLERNKTKHQHLQTAFRKALKSLSFFMCDVRPSRHYNTRIGLQTAHKKKEDGEWIKKALFRGSNQETLAVGCARPKIISVRGRH